MHQEDIKSYKVTQYENYRRYFLGEDMDARLDGNITILLKKGMQSWYIAPILSIPSNFESYRSVDRTDVGLSSRDELARILGNLTIQAMGGL